MRDAACPLLSEYAESNAYRQTRTVGQDAV